MNSFAKKLRAMASYAKMPEVLQKVYQGTKVQGIIDMEQQTFKGKVKEDGFQRCGAVVVFLATAGGLYYSVTSKEKAGLKVQKEENQILVDRLKHQLSQCSESREKCIGAHQAVVLMKEKTPTPAP